MGILNEIVLQRIRRLRDTQSLFPLRDLKAKIVNLEKPRDFCRAVKRSSGKGINIIGEVKKASPSRGTIRQPFDHISIAKIYENKSVNAISVLTEEDYFQGNISFLSDIKRTVSLPLLRKDFLIDEYQVYESRAFEADAILLIAAILGKNQANDYLHLARELGLSVVFEIHNQKDLEKALDIGASLIGINNRNLKTLEVGLDVTFTLKNEIPSEKVIISESGIQTREDVQKMEAEGVHALLIGSAFMQAPDIGQKIDELTGHATA